MSSTKQTIYLSIIYTIIIVGVSYWSGTVTDTGKTLYDRFKVNLNGAMIPITDYQRTVDFYTNVLNFTPITSDKDNRIIGTSLSTGHYLLFRPVSKSLLESVLATSGRNNLLVIHVRNGFRKLHKELIKRSNLPAQVVSNESYIHEVKPGNITEIVKQPWGNEFVISDYDGNRLLFTDSQRQF